MYSINKVFRKKSNWILILIYAFLFLGLIILFKYIFVVQKEIENNIYDKPKNREIIVYDSVENVKNKLKANNNINYIYPDYEPLHIYNEVIGENLLKPYLNIDMPPLLQGHYPQAHNEILLPDSAFINGEKVNFTDYLNQELIFYLNNNLEINFFVSGIYSANSNNTGIFYNLENLKDLLNKDTNNITEYTRVLVNHYRNVEKVIQEIGNNANLLDSGGLAEINVYTSLINLFLMVTIIISIFLIIIMFIISSIIYYDSKNERFILYALGYNYNYIIFSYVNYFYIILLISFALSFIAYIAVLLSYNKYIFIDNIVLNNLFRISNNYLFLIPIIIIILFIFIMLYLITLFRIKNKIKKN